MTENPLLLLATSADRAVLEAMQLVLPLPAGLQLGDVGSPIEGL